MGWDAHSSAEKDWGKKKLKDPNLDKVFKNAVSYVRRKAKGVDGYLRMAGLDCSDCAKMLEQATGESTYDQNSWDSSFIKKLHEKANWDFDYNEDEAWAYWSAKKFLELCARHDLTIKFSW